MFDQTQPEQFKRATRSSFDDTVSSYGTANDYRWQFAARLLFYAPLVPGIHLLDVATGTAPAARLVAQRLGAQGHVIASDISRGILDLAAKNIAADRLGNISLLCADAEQLPLRDASVDGIVCSSAIVWLPNYRQALCDWYRILRPGGWLAYSCFGGPARQALITCLAQALQPYGQQLPELNEPFNTREKCRTLLASAGYTNITVTAGPDMPLPDTADASFAWAWASHRRFGIQLTDEQLSYVQGAYAISFHQLAAIQGDWNHDYEQFVVAYKYI
jgi:ubiquinone/menaquinone biosynthesis C-methylase UbiE